MILSETPETYGAEHLLTRRAVSREVGEKLVGLMRWWEEYTRREGAEINNNPSPGNKAGGLTTILEKSLGAMAKAGSTNLVDVLRYAEPVTAKGFVFMDTPGYDPVSATGQVAGGANSSASPPAAAACSAASRRRRSSSRPTRRCTSGWRTTWTSTAARSSTGRRAWSMRGADVRADAEDASGERTKSERFDFGGAEFAPWVIGATM